MYILGFNCFKHDAAAALIEDGRIIAAAEEERFNGQKHTFAFPVGAIRYCLWEAGISVERLDHVAFYWSPMKFLWNGVIRDCLRRFPHPLGPRTSFLAKSYYFYRTVEGRFHREIVENREAKYRFHYVDHHLAHVGSAYYLSGFESSAFLTLDGAGESATSLLGLVRPDKFVVKARTDFPHSMGYFYSAVTHFLGFKPNNDEYKVMGLASYGKPCYINDFREIVKVQGGGRFCCDLSFFSYHGKGDKLDPWVSQKFLDTFGSRREEGEKITQYHMDLAASAQRRLEEVALELASCLKEMTGEENLC